MLKQQQQQHQQNGLLSGSFKIPHQSNLMGSASTTSAFSHHNNKNITSGGMPQFSSDLEYQKWLLTNGRPLQYFDYNSKPMQQHQRPYAAYTANAAAPNNASNSTKPVNSKMSEVEKIKQELLGYQREIELMQKQREYAKLLKQQQKQQEQMKQSNEQSNDIKQNGNHEDHSQQLKLNGSLNNSSSTDVNKKLNEIKSVNKSGENNNNNNKYHEEEDDDEEEDGECSDDEGQEYILETYETNNLISNTNKKGSLINNDDSIDVSNLISQFRTNTTTNQNEQTSTSTSNTPSTTNNNSETIKIL